MPARARSTTRLFADDSFLYRRIKAEEDATILQADLQALQTWATEWQMEFNPTKCEVLQITRRRNPVCRPYVLCGHTLNTTHDGKYLGVTINDKMLWNSHIDATAMKANNSLAFLRRNIATCPIPVKAQAYKTLVRPILE